MGCFIGDVAEKGDFIAEYVGEMINQVSSYSIWCSFKLCMFMWLWDLLTQESYTRSFQQ